MQPTHKVFNQVPPLDAVNLFGQDQALLEYFGRYGPEWALPQLRDYGALMGSAAWIQKGFAANENPPVFHSHDRYGHRIDRVDYHPAYHDLMKLAIENGLHSLPWTDQRQGAHQTRLALFYLHGQNESGSCCPLSMTFACVPSLKKYLSDDYNWLEKITSRHYNGDDLPYYEKEGLTIGMAMTEKQGGTDVRANTTRAIATDNNRRYFELTGHKWFCSAPICDAFLTLAKTERGLSCFLLPRWRPDGTKNGMQIQRLKDKLGNRSNASSEVEYVNAHAILLGEEGRGVSVIIDMVGLTRYDCMIGSTALMRRAVSEVTHHIAYREVMGKRLIDQPLMQNVAADLCLETEAALAMCFRAAHCLEQRDSTEEALLLRLLLPVGKYWITKRAVALMGEAMECLGGNGYVEQSILPRLYREAPVNAIWEGSGNVQCLDVLRAVGREPQVMEAFFVELERAKGQNKIYDHYLESLKSALPGEQIDPFSARRVTGRLARAFQAAQLFRSGKEWIFDLFCAARLKDDSGLLFGNIPEKEACKKMIDRYHLTHLS